MKIALTGHRPSRLGLPEDELDDKWDAINCWIQTTYKQLHGIDSDIEVLCGMASGSDIRFGMSLAFINGVKLHCVLPCKEYNSSHKYYETLKNVANKWTELSEEFYRGCDNARDQYMVDNCVTYCLQSGMEINLAVYGPRFVSPKKSGKKLFIAHMKL